MATNLTRASQELFLRTPDECFATFADLRQHCETQRNASQDRWHLPQDLVLSSEMTLCTGHDGAELRLNDWSFSQLCRMAGVAKDMINRLTHKTASRALQGTLPHSEKPMQLLTTNESIRSVRGVAYTQQWNADLLDVAGEFASDFQPPQQATSGGTGLYCGEQDMFCFLINPTGWAEIAGKADVGEGTPSRSFLHHRVDRSMSLPLAVSYVERVKLAWSFPIWRCKGQFQSRQNNLDYI